MSIRCRQELRFKLFDHYSELLGSIHPEHDGRYGCPVCMKSFPRSAAEIQSGDEVPVLTFEDVVPKGLGKQWLVLTCQRCNNDLGGKSVDSHLHDQVKFSKLLAGDSKQSRNATLSIGEDSLAIKWSRTLKADGGLHTDFRILPGNDPAKIASTERLLATTIAENLPEFRITFSLPDDRRAAISQLKTGYLASFMKLGYKYILTERLDLVREQLLNPEREVFPVESAILRIDKPPIENALLVLNDTPLQAIAAVFTLKQPLHGSKHRAVLLPTQGSPPDFFDQIARLADSGNSLKFVGANVIRLGRPPRHSVPVAGTDGTLA